MSKGDCCRICKMFMDFYRDYLKRSEEEIALYKQYPNANLYYDKSCVFMMYRNCIGNGYTTFFDYFGEYNEDGTYKIDSCIHLNDDKYDEVFKLLEEEYESKN